MFNRYWRDYPWFLQVTLFGLMAFTMVSFAALVLYTAVPYITGYTVQTILGIDADSSDKLKSAFLWVQGASSVFSFLIAPLLFAYLSTPRVKEYLGLKAPVQPLHILLGIGMMLGAMPLLIEIGLVLKNLVLGTGDDKVERLTKALLDIKTNRQLAEVLIVMALIPAISEEFFFRGVLLRFAHQRMVKMTLPIIITSVLFGAVHGTLYNFLPIAIAGGLLCLIYYWSGSLLTGMVAHFVYNGTQIYMAYLSNSNETMQQISNAKHLPVWVVAAGALVFAASLFAFWKTKTPLPPDWSANFSEAELTEQKQEQTEA
ncbi:hypothetical protein CAP35_02750 [Chitinophagaceae bacterium IBVUCB1]|nr:hypothetical protein CAP35_02750 [Chitinophagaceae bacterium IBVUCB1]